MIKFKTDRTYSLYVRTNSRTRWQYAEYGGRYKSCDEAKAAAIEHFGNTPFEYLIEEGNGYYQKGKCNVK